MTNFTEEQRKKGQAKYEADSLPDNIAYVLFIIVVVLAVLGDNL
jgi:hypothetical protein